MEEKKTKKKTTLVSDIKKDERRRVIAAFEKFLERYKYMRIDSLLTGTLAPVYDSFKQGLEASAEERLLPKQEEVEHNA